MIGRILVAYSNWSNHVSTTADYINSIARYSRFDVRYVHVTSGAVLDFDLNDFDAVFQSYCARLIFDGYVSPDYLSKLAAFRGIKLLAVQDEYERTDKLRQAIRDIGYHAVFSVVPPAMLQRIYPPEMFPATEFLSVLTGYVPEHLERRGTARRLRDRSVTIGYRGREIGPRYGRLGFEKFEIGRRMREVCVERGISHDIDWTDDKRIYGDAWYDFIGSCRATLGSESGSNVFDFDGAIEAKYTELSAARTGPVSFEEFRSHTEPFETRYDMAQISPRVFEAAAMYTPMVLYTGRYSGLIDPGEHYIELKKDFSNIDAVLSQLDDVDGLERLAARAHQRLVGSGEFAYARFVALIDQTIARKAAELRLPLRPAAGDIASSGLAAEPATAANLRQRPTRAPNDPVVFLYKVFAAETKRLNEVIANLQERLSTPPAPSLRRSVLARMAQRLPPPIIAALRQLKRLLCRRPSRASGAR
jgi:hypothetical protein